MPYKETKVYFDGSHYVAIPHTTKKKSFAKKIPDDQFVVPEKTDDIPVTDTDLTPQKSRTVTRKDVFEESYKEALNLPKKERKEYIASKISDLFQDKEEIDEYVSFNIHRKKNNLSQKRVRMLRKAHLMGFNYFCTFTYDDQLLDEKTFKKKLSKCLSNLSDRKGWKYIGVWELSPEKQRLHFHGLFNIPEGSMVGILTERYDYSFSERRRKITTENSFFKERFGRNDFDPINDLIQIGTSVKYLLKYIEKTGEKIVYSRGLPQFFISDIMSEDVVCRTGVEDKKLLLFDNFNCWDEGEYIGEVGPETIQKLRKSSK